MTDNVGTPIFAKPFLSVGRFEHGVPAARFGPLKGIPVGSSPFVSVDWVNGSGGWFVEYGMECGVEPPGLPLCFCLQRHVFERSFALMKRFEVPSPRLWVGRAIAFGFSLLWATAGPTAAESSAGLSAQEKFFENQVRPLLIERCQECHGGDLQESELRLDSLDSILQGGISGPAAVAGDVRESLILKAVLGDELELMPPDGPLEDHEVGILRRWVKMGLPWTESDGSIAGDSIALGDQEAIGEAAKSHWAFQSVGDPTPPPVHGPDERWAANSIAASSGPIDAFLRDRLASEGVSPSPRADRKTLLRRLHVDLVGLPPQPEEYARIVEDPRPDTVVFTEVVDGLLSDPAQAERWARYWLDLARYADTRDWQAQAELRYPYAYTYRDYVIDSFAADKPYAQFLDEQIAADHLVTREDDPRLAALGFLTVGPQFRNNRLEQAADKIDLICRGLMGLTVACARCHDHKYDPVPIEDYYSLYGVFASSELADPYPIIGPSSADPNSVMEFERQLGRANADLRDYKEGLRRDSITDIRAKIAKYLEAYDRLSISKNDQPRGVINKLKVSEAAVTGLQRSLDDRLRRGEDKDDPIFGPWHEALSLSDAEYKSQRKALIEKWSADESLHPRVRQTLTTAKPASRSALIAAYGRLLERALTAAGKSSPKASDEAAGSSTVHDERAKKPTNPNSILAIVEQINRPGGWLDLDVAACVAGSRLFGTGRKKLGDLEKAIVEVEASHPAAPPRAMTMTDSKAIVTPTVFLRGEIGRRGDRVPRQFPAILAGQDRQPFPKDRSGRLELARHVTDPKNPLTARVLVNRVWQRMFGSGLVESSDDFGLQCPPPSHPGLLDHLATEFLRHDGSIKWLIREIATSQAYAQSSQVRESASAKDPANQWLHRQNRQRLDFESMRDAMLQAAGYLDRRVGGRSVRLSDEPAPPRRSLYAYVDRNAMDPMLRTFDFASPTAAATSRSETTIPQQALFHMNHPMVAEMSRDLAQRATRHVEDDHKESSSDPATQHESASQTSFVDVLYEIVFGRKANEQERQWANEFLEVVSSDSASVSMRDAWQYGMGDPAAEHVDGPIEPFPHFTGKEYQGGVDFPDGIYKFAKLTAIGGHPGSLPSHSVIRRWTAPSDGMVRVAGTLRHTRDKGDGVVAVIRHANGRHEFAAMNGTTKTSPPAFAVRAGEHIDLIVSSGPTPTADAFSWITRITGVGGGIRGQSWSTRDDFAPPPPPPLSAEAQLAQALLLTNEFLFVD